MIEDGFKTKPRLEYIFKNLGIYVGEIQISIDELNVYHLDIDSHLILINGISVRYIYEYLSGNVLNTNSLTEQLIDISIQFHFNLENELCLN